MNTEQITFCSADSKSQISGVIWHPDASQLDALQLGVPLGAVQIVHGMLEHMGRYRHFAEFLTAHGYVAFGHDHIGHGNSISDSSELGSLPANGKDIMIADVHQMRQLVQRRLLDEYAGARIPLVLFGHSMGSFVVRAYLAQHAAGVDAAIISGTAHHPLAVSRAGNALARLMARTMGDSARVKLLHEMGSGGYAKSVPNARTEQDWISTDEAVVDAYIADPLVGDMFSAGGYVSLTDLTGTIASAATNAAIPNDLPLLLVSGENDPVGNMGEGVRTVEGLLRKGGCVDVTMKLYANARHELLNEPIKDQVCKDILVWIKEKACPPNM